MSYIHFHAEANSIEDLKRQLREALGDEPTIQAQLPNLRGTASARAVLDSLTAKTSGSTEPVEDEEPKAEPDSNEEAEHEQPKDEKTYSLVDVRAAANAYRDKHGIEKLREIFKKHGGEKLKDIPESNYAALMEDIA